MRSLFITLFLTLFALPLHAGEPRLLASNVINAVLVNGGKQALAHNAEGEFSLIDIASGAVAPWQMDWELEQGGFGIPDEYNSRPNMAVSADGQQVALAYYVEFDSSDPAQDYPNMAYALILCRANGSGARIAALVEPTDGGPHLDFTQDGRYLIGPWFYDCEPTPAGYEKMVASWSDAPEIIDSTQITNALDTQTGQLVNLPSLADTEWGVEKSPYSDCYTYQDMDAPDWHFGCLSGAQAGLTGVWQPESDESGYLWRTTWLGPELLLGQRVGGQIVLSMHGEVWPVPQGSWISYCWLPDGRNFFSRDGGQTIEVGRIDWTTGQVTDGRTCPELAHLAMPLDETGWPERYDTWLALPDSSGALVNTPEMDEGGRLNFVSAD